MTWKIWRYYVKKCGHCGNVGYANRYAKIFSYVIIVAFVIFFITFLLVNFANWKLFLLSLSVKPSVELRALAEDVTSFCRNMTDWESCEESYITQFSALNITYKNDTWYEEYFMLNDNPEYTLKYGNDCDGQTALAISMLKSLHPERQYWLVSEDSHVCFMSRMNMEGTNHYYFQFFFCNGMPINAVLPV